MRPADLHPLLRGLPYMKLAQAEMLYDLITSKRLGKRTRTRLFYHGVSSVYLAGAVQDVSDVGHLTTIDLSSASKREPNIKELLAASDLTKRVTVYFEETSYLWRLMKLLDAGLYGSFDFCYIDGGHGWENTGFAVTLVALLLKKDGWIVLDDLDWTLAKSPALGRRPSMQLLPEEMRQTAGVRKAFELLVQRDVRFCDSFERNGWGFARRA